MLVVKVFTTLLVVFASFWALYVLVIPLLAAVRGRRVRGSSTRSRAVSKPKVAVIIPAHNMERYIVRCIESLNSCGYPQALLDIFVTADHCSDRTVELAAATGAVVLHRDVEPRGKTYTLAWTFDTLSATDKPHDLYIIVDATARVDHGFLDALVARWNDGEQIVIGHPIVDPENLQWFAQCLGLTLAHRNLQNRSRDALGLSAFIGGRGMAFDHSYIERFGWTLALPTSEHGDSHPTEDWRHGVRVVEHGYKVTFADEARLYTPLRESFDAATEQGVRWERGRLVNMATHGNALLARGMKELSGIKILAGLDAIQPPVAVLAGLSLLVAAAGLLAPGLFAVPLAALLPATLILIYAIGVIDQGRRDGIKGRTVLWAPVYIAWRCSAFARALFSLRRA